MSYSTVNFTEAFTNSTPSFSSRGSLDIFVYSINVVFGLPIYFCITWLIITGSKSGVASEFLNLNLAVCEIGNSVNAIVGILSVFHSSFLIVTQSIQGLGITGRPLFQCLMCVERYLAVVHPVTFLKYKHLRYRVICCAVVWILIFGSCFILLSLSMVSYIWFFSTQYLLYLFIQLFCLVAVLRALKQSGPGKRKREKEENHMKRRAFHLILVTTISLIVQYSPFTITGFVILTNDHINGVWHSAYICYVLTGFVTPILYLQRTGKLPSICFHKK